MEHIINVLADFIKMVTLNMGYGGVVLLMGIESACIPLPSEIIMPFAGALCSPQVAKELGIQPWNLHWVAFSGALGCMLGSAATYWIGVFGGRPFVEKYGKFVLIRKKDLDRADKWFKRWGQLATFFSRMLPIIRTFISLPAGVSRMSFIPFIIWAFVGSWPWCYMLAYFGMKLGDNWRELRNKLHGFDTAVAVVLGLLFVFWLYHHLKPEKEENSIPEAVSSAAASNAGDKPDKS